MNSLLNCYYSSKLYYHIFRINFCNQLLIFLAGALFSFIVLRIDSCNQPKSLQSKGPRS